MPINWNKYEDSEESNDEDEKGEHPFDTLPALPDDPSKWPWDQQVEFAMKGGGNSIIYLPKETNQEKYKRIKETKEKKEAEKTKREAKRAVKTGKVRKISDYFTKSTK